MPKFFIMSKYVVYYSKYYKGSLQKACGPIIEWYDQPSLT